MKLLDSLIVVKNALFDLVMALMGRREEENMDESEVSEILPDKAKKKIKKESKDELPDVSERNQDLPVSEVKDDDVETEPKPSMESVLSLKEVEGEVKEEKVHVDSEVLDGLVQSEDFSKINSDAQEPVTSSESTFHNISKTAELDREGRPEVVSSGHPESAENKLQHDEVTQDHIDSVTSMEARDPAEAQESVQELAVDMGTTPEHEEDLKSKLAGNLVEHEPIGFTTVESVSPAELVNKLSDELPNTVIQEMLSEESNLEVAPAQVLKPCKEDEIHVKEMKMMEAALQGAAQLAQETSARKAEAWAAVERTLQSRLQEAEAKAASADERERSINERLSQTLSRINVLEAEISCLRTEQTQLNRSLEKERQRAAENRQEYLAAKEVADTHEGRVNQLEEEIMELKRKHKSELQELLTVTPSVPPVLKTYFRKNKKGGGNK